MQLFVLLSNVVVAGAHMTVPLEPANLTALGTRGSTVTLEVSLEIDKKQYPSTTPTLQYTGQKAAAKKTVSPHKPAAAGAEAHSGASVPANK